ncbi:hypothetical protein G4G28_24600 [Massilia sp. Dwa41.01b]|uniref:hypothetical protein n=1 Tax=unclassified Massilia TaxID=2609279 RepID=UPI0016031E3F|nr:MULTISPECIES: hypothetical protein [unclassified Massilia]QNA90891.1 hypothetical protein G4G28_24600 [Massilia sp. Dwa41.01b]QNA98131.1 hypothetical protein G4G31_03695 [Massilia sp. Se16.2.3]
MKQKLAFCVLLGLFSMSAMAQMVPTSRQECTRRCVTADFPDNPRAVRHQEKIKEIQARKKAEADPEKRKGIDREEADEVEKLADYMDKICTHICKDNPEQ